MSWPKPIPTSSWSSSDDGSSDNTPAVVAGFEDHRIRSLRHRRNFGQSKALNTGIESARGQYVAFLDDDDEWLPHKLADQVAVFDAAPAQVGLVSGWIDVIDDGGRCVRKGRWRLRGDVYRAHARPARANTAVPLVGAHIGCPGNRRVRRRHPLRKGCRVLHPTVRTRLACGLCPARGCLEIPTLHGPTDRPYRDEPRRTSRPGPSPFDQVHC